MRRIAVFTATRAEYGLLRSVIRGLYDSENCEMQLIVSGTHLSGAHGNTLDEITADGFTPAARIPLPLERDSRAGICAAMGKAMASYGETLEQLQPDIVVVLGDRWETFAMAAAAHVSGIVVAHIHGGEKTSGAVDDAFRHSITKMAQLHFTSCEKHRSRVIQLGEAPARVWNVGALGVEAIRRLPLMGEVEIRKELTLDAGVPYFLCTFHPVTLEKDAPQKQLEELFAAFEIFPDSAVIFTGANADSGGRLINDAIEKYAAAHSRHRYFASLGQLRYLSAVKYAACVVGNSSSGILEVPSLGVPVVDIGDRQKGRERSQSVHWCKPERSTIAQAIRSATNLGGAGDMANPYEKAGTTDAIKKVLLGQELAGLLKKDFFDL